ncbi:hypothetical protein SEVIR_3G341500v4 [Setaria viridis]|uniref:ROTUNDIFOLIA like 8 n=2 Tax=Setaria TaxID=4554 RepID=K3ZBE5_SETIT|nr:hypothetical protein SETIT_3G325100v2 [Setaria italica]TKW28594.1 hypothetical protein SEVIR_3G341500v2 [Setaria viridis]
MEMYMDDKSKMLFKKGSRRSSAVAGEGSPVASLKARTSRGPAARSVPGRLASLVKEQRARFYIVRCCVTMLVCWRD